LTQKLLLRQPKQARSQQLIKNICDAALDIAQTSNVQNVTIKAISAKIGAPPASIYRFFQDSDAILEYIYYRWAKDIRGILERIETDPEALTLPWHQFFSKLSEDWKIPDDNELHRIFDDTSNISPRIEEIKVKQRAWFANFFARHMARFGAHGTVEEWRDLGIFLAALDEEVASYSLASQFSTTETLQSLKMKTTYLLVSQLMPAEEDLDS